MEPYYRFKWRRLKRRFWKNSWQRWLVGAAYLKRYVWRRSPRLRWVQRFLLGWLAVMVLAVVGLWWQFGQLRPYYLHAQPADGGIFVEGAVGKLSSLNPLFSDTAPSKLAAQLIFSGLARYGTDGQIEPDLAESWQANSDATQYTVKLKPNLHWQDAEPLTASDVAFTVKALSDPKTASPLGADWKGVRVKALTDQLVEFRLPSPFAPFLNLLTTAVLPEHLLSSVTHEQLQLAGFNNHPVGSGPYQFDHVSLDGKDLYLKTNPHYLTGPPHLRQFVIKTFTSHEELAAALSGRAIGGTADLPAAKAAELQMSADLNVTKLPAPTIMMAFLNNHSLRPAGLRQALLQSVNVPQLVREQAGLVTSIGTPLLPEQVQVTQADKQYGYDAKAAATYFAKSGWRRNAQGQLVKNGQVLTLRMAAPTDAPYPKLAAFLQSQWQTMGITVTVQLLPATDLQTQVITSRAYDVLLNQITIGQDPDVYGYWHSSQATQTGQNFSNYRSQVADAELEAGRTRSDAKIRALEYRRFLQTWRRDVPAIALYRPNDFYVSRGLKSFELSRIVSDTAIFGHASEWALIEKLVPKIED